jgi:hypothetical protein
MKPFAQVKAGKGFVGHRNIGSVRPRQLGFGGKSRGDHATTIQKVHSGVVLRFKSHEILSFQSEDCGGAQPAKPEKQVG